MANEKKGLFEMPTGVTFSANPASQKTSEELQEMVAQSEGKNPYSNIQFTEKPKQAVSPIEMVNPIVQQSPTDQTPPDEKVYLILLVLVPADAEAEETYTFEYVVGRQAVYERLKMYTESEELDLERSQILTSKSVVEDALSVYRFFQLLEEGNMIHDESGFDFHEYAVGSTE